MGGLLWGYSQFQSGLVARVFCNCCRYCRAITSNRVQKNLMYQPLEDLWDEMLVCIYLYVFTGYCIYRSIVAVQSKGLRSGQSLDRWKTLQIHNVRTRPSSPLCPWRIYRCIEWVIGLGSFGARVEECWCQMMWWYPLGFVPVIIFLFAFCNCSHRIDVWDMFTYIWLMFM